MIVTDYATALVKRYKQFGLLPQVFWLDAGWYSKAADWKNGYNWANTVGNWSVDSVRFPQGLGPVGDEVHRAGCKFMVWFEPERVMWLCAYAGKTRYGRYNSQVCGKHTESAKAGRFRASAMGVVRDLPAVNANETVYRNALILAILLAANSFYHTSAPIARIKVPLFLSFSPI